MKTETLAKTKAKIIELLAGSQSIFVAYSGGLDSHVLLHLLTKLYSPKKLTAIHINHHTGPASADWVAHCRKICKKLQVNYISSSVEHKNNINECSPEEFLRELRYTVLAKLLPKNGILLTAHHANDQAETLLLQLFRGAGPKGLAAMPLKTKFSTGWLVRPLLDIPRQELVTYAKKEKLIWIEDQSNQNLRFDRNFIRHQLLPIIQKRWPGIIMVLNRTSRHLRTAEELLTILAQSDLNLVISKNNPACLDLKILEKIPVIRQKNLLRFWFTKQAIQLPSEIKLNEIIRTIINSRSDTIPIVKWKKTEARKFRNNLYLIPVLVPHDQQTVLAFNSNKKLQLPANLGTLKLEITPGSKIDPKKISVTFRQGGEKIKLFKAGKTRELKKLMQEWQIPPWLRDRIPLVYYARKIIAIPGYYQDSSISITKVE